MVKAKKKEEVQRKITVFVAPRGKKRLTVVCGLKTFGKSFFFCPYSKKRKPGLDLVCDCKSSTAYIFNIF